ncbi:MAG: hypothetical protein ABJA71_01215 [Ginsengibacter sp.]
MHPIITSYLLQAAKCVLPNIGFFKIKYKPAESDVVNMQIAPPVEEIVFNEQANFLSPGLIKYVAAKKNILVSEAESLVNNFCKEWKEKIEGGEVLCFESFGCLQKNDAGIISFTKEERAIYFKTLSAERVLHDNAEHAVLVGDTETTSTLMNEYYSEEAPVVKRRWVIPAIILTSIALVILFYSFYNHKISVSAIGNRSHFTIKSVGKTHFKPIK